ncbi:MAG: GPR1/FUN34/YaaH family transporter [Candidatus Thermoplasmatota archaeon]|nr:GPR1/FUN34/YaaH family transporter [Candidatus Thermoplasmatota archaeon]
MVEKTTNSDINIKSIPFTIAEPAAFGLFGLAIAAFVLGAADLGLTSSSKSLMIPWVLMFGATAQLIASVMDFKRKNIFGATVFGIYSMTMYAIAITLIITIFTDTAQIIHYAFGLIAILFFSIIATVASLMTNKVLFAILIAVDLAVISLIPHYLNGISPRPAGVFLMITSALSFYGAGAVLINTIASKTIIPLGKPLWKPK